MWTDPESWSQRSGVLGCDRTHRSEGTGQTDQALYVPHYLLMLLSLILQGVGSSINQRKLWNELQPGQNSEIYAFGGNCKEFICALKLMIMQNHTFKKKNLKFISLFIVFSSVEYNCWDKRLTNTHKDVVMQCQATKNLSKMQPVDDFNIMCKRKIDGNFILWMFLKWVESVYILIKRKVSRSTCIIHVV